MQTNSKKIQLNDCSLLKIDIKDDELMVLIGRIQNLLIVSTRSPLDLKNIMKPKISKAEMNLEFEIIEYSPIKEQIQYVIRRKSPTFQSGCKSKSKKQNSNLNVLNLIIKLIFKCDYCKKMRKCFQCKFRTNSKKCPTRWGFVEFRGYWFDCQSIGILENEIKEILKLWKYIKNLILMLKDNFALSCRLLKSMAKETLEYHTKTLPDWLMDIFSGWYADFEVSLCDRAL